MDIVEDGARSMVSESVDSLALYSHNITLSLLGIYDAVVGTLYTFIYSLINYILGDCFDYRK